jgi:hypothetical protein
MPEVCSKTALANHFCSPKAGALAKKLFAAVPIAVLTLVIRLFSENKSPYEISGLAIRRQLHILRGRIINSR